MDVNSINTTGANFRNHEPPVANSKVKSDKSQEMSDDPKKPVVVSRSELDRAVERANKIGQNLKRRLNFSIDEATDRVVVKIIDEDTGEIVRQVPPQEMLRIAAHLKRLQDMNDKVLSAVKSVILDLSY